MYTQIPLCIYSNKQNIWPYPQEISLSQCLALRKKKMFIFADTDWTAQLIRLTYVNSVFRLYLRLMFLFSRSLLMLEFVFFFPLIFSIAVYQVVCVSVNMFVGIKGSVQTFSILYTPIRKCDSSSPPIIIFQICTWMDSNLMLSKIKIKSAYFLD